MMKKLQGVFMKYLQQSLTILGFSLLGEVLQMLIPIPIPASVYGMVLLFVALCLRLVKLEQVKDVGNFMISLLPFLLVSPSVGIIEHWGIIQPNLLPLCIIIVATTVLTFGISGRLTQLFTKKGGKRHA